MTLLTRRAAVAGCLCCAGGSAAAAPIPGGCRVLYSEAPPPGFTDMALDPDYVEKSTGNETIDKMLGDALWEMADFFQVRPGVGMYDDYGDPGALTYTQSFLPNTRGTVVMGRIEFKRQMTYLHDTGVSVIGLFAHEFGHVMQNDNGIADELLLPGGRVKHIELHADFLAGLYLAEFERTHPGIRLYETGQTFNKLGDDRLGDPRHHGTAAERTLAIEFGHSIGAENPQLRPATARKDSIGFIRTYFPDQQ